MASDSSAKPYPFEYYVFASSSDVPTAEEIASGCYLVESADARYIEQFLNALYHRAGIEISTTEDISIHGAEKLDALTEALREALHVTRQRPSTWPVRLGYRLTTFSERPGTAVIGEACRTRIMAFLECALTLARHARDSDGIVHFGGGA